MFSNAIRFVGALPVIPIVRFFFFKNFLGLVGSHIKQNLEHWIEKRVYDICVTVLLNEKIFAGFYDSYFKQTSGVNNMEDDVVSLFSRVSSALFYGVSSFMIIVANKLTLTSYG